MKLIQVNNKSVEKLFLNVARKIYEKDKNWVCPLDSDIKSVFNPEKNHFFKDGEAVRWVLLNEKKNPVGRIAAFYNLKIAAFYNLKKASSQKILSGGAGYFECINDQAAANILFDAARNWLMSKGMKAMDAPVNFGENDTNWGLLVDGFTQPGLGIPYHLPYNKDLFEKYGFHLYYRQFSYHLDLTKKFPERFWKIADRIRKKPDFSFEHFTFRNSEKYIHDMVHIHDAAWIKFKDDYTPINPDTLRESLRKVKPILDEELIWFAYYKNEPISFFIMFPDANQIFKEFNGKLHIWNVLRFLYFRKSCKINRIRAIAAGVVPKFQNSGVESAIFWHLGEVFKHKPHYHEIELSWVGDYNPKMLSINEAIGGVKVKTHHTYRYMLDKSIPFERFMPDKVAEP